MESLIVIIIGFLVFGIGIRILESRLNQKELTYSSKLYLLSKTETKFFDQLLEHLPPNFYVSTKVRLFDVVKPSTNKQRYISLRNKISSKHLDFVIIDKTTSKILMAIELDDRSHSSINAKSRDKIKELALNSAEIKFIRVPVFNHYDFDYLNEIKLSE